MKGNGKMGSSMELVFILQLLVKQSKENGVKVRESLG